MRAYEDLLSNDPAWPAIAAAATSRVTILPRDPGAARSCLESLQVTTRSPLGAVAHETGGILVDHGWLRVLGSGHARLARTLGGWNATLAVPLSDLMIVADDAVGGVFALDGGGLGLVPGHVCYFAPDRLGWEDTELGYGAWIDWVFTGDLETFYADIRWPGWEREVDRLSGDRTLSLWPPPWTEEGKDVSKVSRRDVPAAEIWRLHQDAVAQLDGGG